MTILPCLLNCSFSNFQRKRDALALDGKTTAVIEEKEVLWRVNFEELIRRLRHKVTLQQAFCRVSNHVLRCIASNAEREIALCTRKI